MRRALILSIALTALAGVAQAQNARPARPPADGQAAGLRYLTWAGKAETETRTSAHAAPAPSIPTLRPATARTAAPPRLIPHGGVASIAAPPPTPVRDTLTPANAWMRRAADHVDAVPPPAPVPTPVPAPTAQPMAPAPAPADPMAPRRDAPLFRIAAAAPVSAEADAAPRPVQPATTTGAPARYYSLHRQNGRRPDAIAMPSPVYLDALPVELERAPQSEDLAEPPAAPTVLRDNNGRVRPAPPAINDDIQ